MEISYEQWLWLERCESWEKQLIGDGLIIPAKE
jgi:hypothetical protein